MDFTNGNFRIKILHHISEGAATWDAFNPSSPQLHARYLAGLESADPSDMEFRYVFIYKGDHLAACAYLQLVNFSEKNFSGRKSSPLILFLKLLFRIKKVRLLFCGNLFSVDYPCLSFDKTMISFEDAVAILHRIYESERCQLMMLKEINTGDADQHFLTSNGFRKYGEDLTMKLDIRSTWESFDDYFKALSKKYRKRLAHIIRSGAAVEVRKLSEQEVKENLPRIEELFNQTASKQFLRMGIIDRHYFTAMMQAYGDRFMINGYFHEGKMVAFSSHINHPDTLEVHYIGIDYSFNEQFSLYFIILYEGVAKAISLRKKYLELGRTAREAKASVGCIPSPSYDYLFVSDRIINLLVKIFENLFLDRMGDEWKNRHPFKKVIHN